MTREVSVIGRGLQIAMVSEHASPLALLGGVDAGGQNVYVASLATELAAAGCEVVVYTRRDHPALPQRVPFAPGVWVEHVAAGPPVPLPKDGLFGFMGDFGRQLARRWTAERPDVVHAHFWMSGFAAVRAASAVDVPVLQTFHALGTVKRRHQGAADTSPPQRLTAERRLLRQVDTVVATCRDEVEELLSLGADARRVRVVPCGVDVAQFHPDGPVAPRRAGRHRLVAVSRLVPRKGVDDAVRALALLPDTELVVAGGPPSTSLGDDPEVRRLRAVAREAGFADRVRLVGALSREEVAELLRSADAVVCAPWYEPFGIVPVEAMACGAPVIGTAVGGLLDTIDDGRTGLLVPPRSPEAIAAAARRLLDDPDQARRMGRAGVRRVRRRYTWRQVSAEMLRVYHEVVQVEPAEGMVGA